MTMEQYEDLALGIEWTFKDTAESRHFYCVAIFQ